MIASLNSNPVTYPPRPYNNRDLCRTTIFGYDSRLKMKMLERTVAPIMRSISRVIVLLTTIVFALLLIPACLMGLFAPMAFDAGADAKVWLLVGSIWTFPVLALCSIGLSWLLLAKNAFRSAIVVSVLRLVNILIVVAMFAFFH
jgi:hypothetical protein